MNTKIAERQAILDALNEEPRLTTRQIAKLLHGKTPLTEPDARVLNNTHKMLQRMEKQGFIYDIGRPHATLDTQWASKRISSLVLSTYEHERFGADVYVACKTAGNLEKWEGKIGRKDKQVIEDRYARWQRKEIYFEVDRCSMGEKKLSEKISRYMKRTGWFHVVFVVCSPLPDPDKKFDQETKQAGTITKLLPTDSGTKYLVTIHSWFANDPLGECFVSANRQDSFQRITDLP